jgi:hypothetical protein
MENPNEQQASWRPRQWLRIAGNPFSLVTLYKEIHAGRIEARKVGPRTTVIITSPRDYFAQLPRELGRSPNPLAHRAA